MMPEEEDTPGLSTISSAFHIWFGPTSRVSGETPRGTPSLSGIDIIIAVAVLSAEAVRGSFKRFE